MRLGARGAAGRSRDQARICRLSASRSGPGSVRRTLRLRRGRSRGGRVGKRSSGGTKFGWSGCGHVCSRRRMRYSTPSPDRLAAAPRGRPYSRRARDDHGRASSESVWPFGRTGARCPPADRTVRPGWWHHRPSPARPRLGLGVDPGPAARPEPRPSSRRASGRSVLGFGASSVVGSSAPSRSARRLAGPAAWPGARPSGRITVWSPCSRLRCRRGRPGPGTHWRSARPGRTGWPAG